MKKLTRLIAAAALPLLVLSLAACGGSSSSASAPAAAAGSAGNTMESYNWTAAMSVADTTINYKIVRQFADSIKEKSGGKINVDVYTSGQMGNTTEFNQGVVAGSIDIGSGMTSDIVDFVPQAALFDIPNLFANVGIMRKVLQGDFMNVMNEYNKKGGIRMLGYADAGFRQLTSNKAVRKIGDLSGQKIRVMTNPYHLAYWKALGANPVVMEFTEVFMGLKQGTIDGQENPYMNIVGNNMQEAQKFIIETNHVGHIITFFMNNARYDGLPENVRALVDSCSSEAVAYGNAQADESIAGYKQTCVTAGCEIIVLPESELAQFRSKAAVVSDMVREALGAELVDTLQNEIRKAGG
ncbi:MAG: TRAP transporter substrate-binding protein [Spirochaetales bacterium]|jgi:tripartite ATP-independent transporter DctP family solute receptor|nr:TRAP transporter substrate-binding protein [Spirochaetales bacterium]